MKTPAGLRLAIEPFHLLEISVLSAQDLHPESRSMSTYGMAWIQPDRKLCTRVDSVNHTNPHWNDKFIFRVDEWFLHDETSAVTVEIHCVGWLRDTLIGSARIRVGDLLQRKSPVGIMAGIRFAALPVRRPSGRPQGILNIGVAILDASLRSVPLFSHKLKPEKPSYPDLAEESFRPLRRTKSISEIGSVVNGAYAESVADTVEESEVAAEKASSADRASVAGVDEDFLAEEIDGSILEDWSVASNGGKEDLRVKFERWRSEFPVEFDPVGSSVIESPFIPVASSGKTTPGVVKEEEEEEEEGPAAFVCSVTCGVKSRKKTHPKAL